MDTTPLRPVHGSRFVSTGTAALMLGVTAPTVRALLDLGELKGHRVGRVFRVERSSVDSYLRRMSA